MSAYILKTNLENFIILNKYFVDTLPSSSFRKFSQEKLKKQADDVREKEVKLKYVIEKELNCFHSLR